MTVYLKLLHGRLDRNQEMRDWGFDGPVLGPFEAVHFMYRDHIRCISDSATEREIELGFADDLLIYEGKYYGDFEIAADFGDDTPTKLSPEPERMNDDRARWAAAALRQFQCATGSDYEDSLGDLLGDLMHWSDRNNFDFEAALFRARGHYRAEAAALDHKESEP
jgi:hypothetical protein